jgi:hypothetical protein
VPHCVLHGRRAGVAASYWPMRSALTD